jgi:hypothetical protein
VVSGIKRGLTFRYSLRALLVVSALVPLAVYWLALPTLNARRYAAAIAARDFAVADALCVSPGESFPGDWTRHATFEPKASVKPLTWEDFRHGERQLYVGITYGDGSGLASCSLECTATRRGIEPGMLAP